MQWKSERQRRLERKARPRSGSPELDVVILALVNIISPSAGTVVFTVCAIAVSFGFTSTSTGSTSGGGEFMSESTSTHNDA